MPEYIVRDSPRYTVSVLLAALKRGDPEGLRDTSHAVLLSTVNHLFLSDPSLGADLAMSRLLLILRENYHD